MPDISELDDQGQKLRVLWHKTNNFYAAFARELFETKTEIESGNYGDVTFASWLSEAGLSEELVMKLLAVHILVLPADLRERLEWENTRIAAEKHAAKLAAQAAREAKKQRKAEVQPEPYVVLKRGN